MNQASSLMSPSVIPIGTKRRGCWSLLEIARPGRRPVPYGILLADWETGEMALRLRALDCFEHLEDLEALEEDEFDVLSALDHDLRLKAREMGGLRLLDLLEDSLSGFFRIGDRTTVIYSSAQATVDRLFDEHVDSTVREFVTHLPLYGLRAAATKFGEGMDSELESWMRVPENLHVTEGMFAAHVVGRSMEPVIPDGSICIFRAPVTGSRVGRLLLIEKFGETDFASRYTVKRYARRGLRDESAERETAIRLEPLNSEFDPLEMASDEFRVIAEFVQVLEF
jgi:SOS-response transcriptional repressor LexA